MLQISHKLSRIRCPYCHDQIGSEDLVRCTDCQAATHRDCWTEIGFCATCRCKSNKQEKAAPTAEVDPELWKTCPRTWPKQWYAQRFRVAFRGCHCDGVLVKGKSQNHKWPCGWCPGSWTIRGCGKPINYLGFCTQECYASKRSEYYVKSYDEYLELLSNPPAAKKNARHYQLKVNFQGIIAIVAFIIILLLPLLLRD